MTTVNGLSSDLLRGKSQAWHEDPAKVIVLIKGVFKPTSIGQASLIPLRDGSWVSSPSGDNGRIYFETGGSGCSVPPGIDIRIVAPVASACTYRRDLFDRLRVKTCNQVEVCKAIMERHKGEAHDLDQATMSSHLVYLFQTRSSTYNNDLGHLWLSSSVDYNAKRGKDLYMDNPRSEFAVSAYLTSGLDNVAFIHDTHLKTPDGADQDTWIEWLIKKVHVSDIPRLCESSGSILSPAFRSILQERSSSVFVKILTDNWSRYSPNMSLSIKKEISSITVDTTSSQQSLRGCILPLPELIKISTDLGMVGLPFLRLGSIEDLAALRNLSAFGIVDQ